MSEYQVGCINRDGPDSDRRIDRLGGPEFKPSPIDDVIRWIVVNGHRFYVVANGQRAYLEVKEHPASGRKYLRTIPDGLYDNNLYALPECPK